MSGNLYIVQLWGQNYIAVGISAEEALKAFALYFEQRRIHTTYKTATTVHVIRARHAPQILETTDE